MSPIPVKAVKEELLPTNAPCPKCKKLDRVADRRNNFYLDRLHGYRLLKCNRCRINYTQYFDSRGVVVEE